MPISKHTQEIKNAFQREKYDSISVLFKKGEKAIVDEFAKKNGESINGYVTRLIKEDMMERWY